MTETCNPNAITRYEAAVGAFFAMLAFRVCTLPTYLALVAGESMAYALLLGLALDTVLTALCLEVSRRGGIAGLPLPKIAKRVLSWLVGLLCLGKVSLHLAEMVTYCTAELFDEAMALSLAAVLVVGVAFLATKGFAGVGRTALVCSGIAAVLLVLTFVFTSYRGYSFNLWSLLRPARVGDAFVGSAIWLGDGLFFLLADTSEDVRGVRDYRPVRLTLLAAWVVAAVFALLMVYTYGSAIDLVQYAFSRLFVNGNPESLGAVDWPVLLLWLIGAFLHIGNLFCAACAGLRLAPVPRDGKGYLAVVFVAILSFGGYLLLAKSKDSIADLSKTVWLDMLLLVSIVVISTGCAVASWCAKGAVRRGQI